MKSQYLETLNLVHNAGAGTKGHREYDEMKNRYLPEADSLSEEQLKKLMKNHYLNK